MLTDWNTKEMYNVLSDRFMEYIKKFQATLCMTTYKVVGSDVFLVIIRYRAHTIY